MTTKARTVTGNLEEGMYECSNEWIEVMVEEKQEKEEADHVFKWRVEVHEIIPNPG